MTANPQNERTAAPAPKQGFGQLVIAGLLSGAVLSTVVGFLLTGHTTRIEEEIRSRRSWKERSVEELLGPVNMQLDRTNRAFVRWTDKNIYLEYKVIFQGDSTVRELLLSKGHLIPPDLLEDAGKLIEHYDVWIEKFARKRRAENPDLETPFIFVGPDGYSFPRPSADRFQARFREYWKELYEEEPSA